jgi:hypothetical protein
VDIRQQAEEVSRLLKPQMGGVENPFTTAVVYDVWNDTVKDGALLGSTSSALWYHFRRAPGFFDVVAYPGTGSANSVSHNLGVAPELIIVKSRSGGDWATWATALGLDGQLLINNTNAAQTLANYWSGLPTSSSFSVSSIGYSDNNGYGSIYIAYLFATAPGVSKVGSYTGTGTTLNIDCGFTAGARFILIKRTDSTGDWYVWDTARGITSGNDPYLLLIPLLLKLLHRLHRPAEFWLPDQLHRSCRHQCKRWQLHLPRYRLNQWNSATAPLAPSSPILSSALRTKTPASRLS